MELGLCLDDDFYTEETKKDKPREKPYNVKLCERDWIFNSPICSDKVEKQNITKFKADVWYRDGQYAKALKSYKFIQENPQVSSSTVEREINESVFRCHIKLQQFDEAVHVIQSMMKDQGNDTAMNLMLAKICAATGNIQGEIACFKKCIALHSYNHHFWYSLALAYGKAYDNKESSDITDATCRNGKICNNEAVACRVAEALRESKTKNHKDSLKIFINCCHCKCLREMDSGINCSKVFNQDHLVKKKNNNELAEEEDGSENEKTLIPVVDEIVIFMEGLSIDKENEVEERADDSVSCNFSKSDNDTKDIETIESHLEESSNMASASGQDQGCCSFSVKLKSSKNYQQQAKQTCDKMALNDQLNLFAFFCLIRARFHLQRAVWTSSSFIKERLTKELAEVNERIDKYEPCKCGKLKGCCLKVKALRKQMKAAQQRIQNWSITLDRVICSNKVSREKLYDLLFIHANKARD